MWGVDRHGAELSDNQASPVPPDTLLAKDGRTSVLDAYDHADQQGEWC